MKNFFLTLCISFFLFLPITTVHGQSDINKQTSAFVGGQGANLGSPQDPRSIAASVIKNLLGLVGILMIAYVMYGGYLIMTSAGNEEKVKKGSHVIRNGVIGLFIILSAYAIALFVNKIIQGGDQIPEGVSTCIQRTPPSQVDPFGEDINTYDPEKVGIPYCDQL